MTDFMARMPDGQDEDLAIKEKRQIAFQSMMVYTKERSFIKARGTANRDSRAFAHSSVHRIAWKA